jgi:hypothetical protein
VKRGWKLRRSKPDATSDENILMTTDAARLVLVGR